MTFAEELEASGPRLTLRHEPQGDPRGGGMAFQIVGMRGLRDLSLAQFREEMQRTNDPTVRTIVNFHRGPIFGKGADTTHRSQATSPPKI